MDEIGYQVVMVCQEGMAFPGLLEWQERRESQDHQELKVSSHCFFTKLIASSKCSQNIYKLNACTPFKMLTPPRVLCSSFTWLIKCILAKSHPQEWAINMSILNTSIINYKAHHCACMQWLIEFSVPIIYCVQQCRSHFYRLQGSGDCDCWPYNHKTQSTSGAYI